MMAVVHSGQTFHVSRERLLTQWELDNDPALRATRDTVRSSVLFAAFRDFLAALNEETFELTSENIGGLSLLCAEFGFRAFPAKISEFSGSRESSVEDPFRAFAVLRGALSGDALTFIADDREIKSGLTEAAALSRLVREQLSVDACARKLAVNGGAVGVAFASLWRILSDSRISADKSVGLVGGLLGNPAAERLSVRAPLRADDLSGPSVDAVDGLLSGATFSVESEDALLDSLLKLDPAHSPLLRHIQPTFLSPDCFLSLLDHLARPPESVWLSLAERLRTPPPPPPGPFDSLIVSDFPQIFAPFHGMRFSLLRRGSRDGFRGCDFHSRCDGHANTLTVILETKGNGFTSAERLLENGTGCSGKTATAGRSITV
jgi:hypothetical protein